MRWLIWNIHKFGGISTPICVFRYFHYITMTATVFCPPLGPYLRNGFCDSAESWLIGTAMRWLIRNTHIIKGISIPICAFMYFHYITVTATVFCPPLGPYLGKCLCNLAESWLVGMAMRCLIRNIHKIKGISIPIYVFMYFHYIVITALYSVHLLDHISGTACVIGLKVGLLELQSDG